MEFKRDRGEPPQVLRGCWEQHVVPDAAIFLKAAPNHEAKRGLFSVNDLRGLLLFDRSRRKAG